MEIRQYMPDRPMVSVSFGISEPDLSCPILTQDEIDLILVPAVCYDKAGYRLGFGGGYYDRWLEHFNGFRVGMCRNAVLQDKVPTEPTTAGWTCCSPRRRASSAAEPASKLDLRRTLWHRKEEAPAPRQTAPATARAPAGPTTGRRSRSFAASSGMLYAVAVIGVSILLACVCWIAANDVLALNKPEKRSPSPWTKRTALTRWQTG